MKKNLLIALALGLIALLNPGCKNKLPLPETSQASKRIQDLIIENGQMPGGNPIEIHTFEIKKIEAGNQPQTARIHFKLDYTRYPTSGLAPEYQTDKPMRQTEDHQAVLIQDKEKWTVQDISLR